MADLPEADARFLAEYADIAARDIRDLRDQMREFGRSYWGYGRRCDRAKKFDRMHRHAIAEIRRALRDKRDQGMDIRPAVREMFARAMRLLQTQEQTTRETTFAPRMKYVAIDPATGLHLRAATRSEVVAVETARTSRFDPVRIGPVRVGFVLIDEDRGPGAQHWPVTTAQEKDR